MIIAADKIISGDKNIVIDDGAIVIDGNGTIVKIGKRCDIEREYGNEKVDYYEGCSIMPGLIDMHTHIGFWQMEPDASARGDGTYSEADKAFFSYSKLQEATRMGVTTVRNVGNPDGLDASLKKASIKKHIKIPRVITSNCAIAITGGHGSEMTDSIIEADGVEEVRKAVRYNLKKGADWIKVMGSHGPKYCQFTQEELNTAVSEAHMTGHKCALHATTLEATIAGIEAGFDTIEHSNFLTPELAKKAVKNNVAWIPTLFIHCTAYQALTKIKEDGKKPVDEVTYKLLSDTMKSYKNNFVANYKTGIKIGVGTDAINFGLPITPVREELAIMVDLGLTPLEAIECATLLKF